MKHLFTTIIACALLAIATACSSKPEATLEPDPYGYEYDDTEVTLNDNPDSLGYYLALSMGEYIRTAIAEDSTLSPTDIDPQKFNEGLKSVLQIKGNHPGFQQGAAHGASLQKQINIFRSAKIKVNTSMLIKGLSDGMNGDTANHSAQQLLDKLMGPVNNQLLIEMMRRKHSRYQK